MKALITHSLGSFCSMLLKSLFFWEITKIWHFLISFFNKKHQIFVIILSSSIILGWRRLWLQGKKIWRPLPYVVIPSTPWNLPSIAFGQDGRILLYQPFWESLTDEDFQWLVAIKNSTKLLITVLHNNLRTKLITIIYCPTMVSLKASIAKNTTWYNDVMWLVLSPTLMEKSMRI